MQQKSCHKMIFKLHSKQLRAANWDFSLDLRTAMRNYPDCIISLGDSQLLRFIDEINQVSEVDEKVRAIQSMIRKEKKRPRSKETRMMINSLYDKLYELQFQKDYLCVIMDSNKDYDLANLGFIVNGIKFRRFLGTNGGIKNSTIVYVNEELYPELKRRLDNGRNMQIPLVPAKLEAYQALICSGSTPIPEPKGIIVVKDCITHFKDDVILINDETDGEPLLSFQKDYEIEHNDSDGYGLMLPSYSRRVNEYLTGDGEHEIAGFNSRYAWTKGMLYCFDFIEFAEKVAGTYEVVDVWGAKRDIRDAEVILTESMLKLWMCYDSWEDYYENCQKNHYQFSTPKITPQKLENVRDTNYQFLQSYTLSDEELAELCQPTIDELNAVLGLDYKKSLAFLAGFSLNDRNAFGDNFDYYIKALMIDKQMINDPFIRRKIWNMISKRIEMAKRGAIRVRGNYAMISGDPYALAQNMFGLEVTGLLKRGEVYHKYWIDKGADEIVCFRAPMTCHNNIRRMKLCKSNDALYWYQYITTALIYNAWDTSCEAMNGADKDGDTNMCTDNPVLIEHTLNSPTIICMQRKAEKKIVTEPDIIEANKLAFNDDIGTVTNYVTSMIERQAGFEVDSKEYEVLGYRIMCGQHYQQATIDRAKGVIAKPMPTYWYNPRDTIARDGDDEQTIKTKEFNHKIVAANKPYFMIYVYPALRTKYLNYIKNNNNGALIRFGNYNINGISDLKSINPRTQEIEDYLSYYRRHFPVGDNPCTINRMCWLFESCFSGFSSQKNKGYIFDCSILKSNVQYTKSMYDKIAAVYQQYLMRLDNYQRTARNEKIDKDASWLDRHNLIEFFKAECEQICSNEDELCDIIIDLCYKTDRSKQFAWDICGDTILKNLLRANDNTIHYPQCVENEGEFEFCGRQFIMAKKRIGEEDNDFVE